MGVPDFGLLGDPAQLTDINGMMQRSAVNQQSIEQNHNALAQQQLQAQAAQRGEVARQAAAKIATTPNIDDATFEQLLQPIAQADPSVATQMRRQRSMQRDAATMLQRPTPGAVLQFNATYPEAMKDMNTALDGLNAAQKQSVLQTASDIHSLIAPAVDPRATPEQRTAAAQSAMRVLKAHEDADAAAGLDTSKYAALHETLQTNPTAAFYLSGSIVAGIAGPDKYGATYKDMGETDRATQLQPAAIAEADAKASTAQTEAQYKPQMIQSDIATKDAQIQRWSAQTEGEKADRQLGWAKFGLDKDALETQTALKLEELQRAAGKVPDSALGPINERITASVTHAAIATRAADLAQGLRASGARGGAGSGWAEWIKQKTGNQDSVSQIRSEYSQFINGAALKSLPAGAASDKDVTFVMKGFPPETAPPAYVAKWLEAYGKVQSAVASASERQGNWMAANGGSLGPARSDITVGGVTVRAGTPYAKFNNSGVTQERSATLPAGIAGLADRYGKR